ncbi:hypothetical protein GCM10010116_52030 [Microbispora rosea subsp. aerata]|nr:hypothetical protein GCM10010116_52030 [Microbispora rosea subsp. aerata]GIH58174.1 hypothetical protein Mro02_50880 [Microbispora rosea subsp. aerata]GLJ87052.1 hypothetical protein GCM10017588_57950 [Microbispora rosea subsp. aerata]
MAGGGLRFCRRPVAPGRAAPPDHPRLGPDGIPPSGPRPFRGRQASAGGVSGPRPAGFEAASCRSAGVSGGPRFAWGTWEAAGRVYNWRRLSKP